MECRILKKLYDKSNILFAILWIVAYCVLMSLGDALSAMVGVEKSVTVVVGFLLSAVLWLFFKKERPAGKLWLLRTKGLGTDDAVLFAGAGDADCQFLVRCCLELRDR